MTLEKVKNYFKNALIVQDFNGNRTEIKNVDGIHIRLGHNGHDFYYGDVLLWSNTILCSEILEYKKNMLEISENVLEEIYNSDENEKRKILEREYPKLFKELEVGKWYAVDKGEKGNALVCYRGSVNNPFYGINCEGVWSNNVYVGNNKTEPVLDSIVLPVLLNEAYRLGFSNKDYYKIYKGGLCRITDDKKEPIMINGFWETPTIKRNGKNFKLIEQ